MSIVDFGDTRVREVMTPRTDIVWIDVASSLTVLVRPLRRVEVLAHPGRARLDRHGRRHRPRQGLLPGDSLGRQPLDRGPDARGVLRARDQEGLRAAARVPAAPPLDGHRGGRVRRRVRNRHGRGPPRGDRGRDLRRARGRARAGVRARASSAYSVSGKANIEVIRDLFGRGPEEEEFTTVGGFLSSRLGHIPKPGETYREFGAALHRRGSRPATRVPRQGRAGKQLTAYSSQLRAGGRSVPAKREFPDIS